MKYFVLGIDCRTVFYSQSINGFYRPCSNKAIENIIYDKVVLVLFAKLNIHFGKKMMKGYFCEVQGFENNEQFRPIYLAKNRAV